MDYLIICIAIAGLLLLVTWHSKHFAYICKSCGNKFTLSALEDLISPQGVTTKYAKCPKCNKRTWARVINQID
jgi:DNA-directed RNA polymerase subunit RPC12/RpoP